MYDANFRIQTENLGDSEGSLHASATVRFAVVFIGSSLFKLHGECLSLLAQLVAHGDGFLVNSRRNRIFVKDNIVRSRFVVNPSDRVTSANSKLCWLKGKKTRIGSHLKTVTNVRGLDKGYGSFKAETIR